LAGWIGKGREEQARAGQGRVRLAGYAILGREPHTAHAHFAELGLAPRPEGKERSRLKASKHSLNAHAMRFDTPVLLLLAYPMCGLLSRDEDFFFLSFFLSFLGSLIMS
jgi:hypothetical protein